MLVDKNKFSNISINLDERNLRAEGPLGVVSKNFSGVDVEFLGENRIFFFSKSSLRAFSQYVSSLEKGLKYGYFARLNLVGLGFRFLKINDYFLLKLGYSHYIKVKIPEDLHVFGFKRSMFVFSLSKFSVNEFCEILRSFRYPDAYKGKGVQYYGERLTFKEGKRK